ncbi:MAG: 50S ribosomal protein L25 [bacterium]|nr:50S ribosomal protein L25 [bacterium]
MELVVEKRDTKTNPHTLRRKGLLPAVVYGRSEASTPITINAKEFGKLFHAAGESTVISLKGLGTSTKDALIHEVDFDTLTGVPIHADFYAIEKGQKVTVSVPLEFDGISPAVKEKGGILTKIMHELEIECEPKDLPQAIHVDISVLVELDSQIHVSDLKLPASAKISAGLEEVVAMISVAKEEPVEEVAAPVDLSAIEISEDRGKKEEEGAPAGEAAAPAAPKAEKKKE